MSTLKLSSRTGFQTLITHFAFLLQFFFFFHFKLVLSGRPPHLWLCLWAAPVTFKTLNNLTNKTCGWLVGLERRCAGKKKPKTWNYCEVFVMFGAVFDLDLAAVGRSLGLDPNPQHNIHWFLFLYWDVSRLDATACFSQIPERNYWCVNVVMIRS